MPANPELLQALRDAYPKMDEATKEKAADLGRRYHEWGGWTDKQVVFVTNLINRVLAPKVELDLSRLNELFDKATESGLKRAKMVFQVGDLPMQMSRGNDGRTIWVNDRAPFGERTTFAKVTHAGKYEERTHLAGLVDELKLIAEDPAGYARMFGQATGVCCCCGRELTNAESIRMGIGPICAEKWGL